MTDPTLTPVVDEDQAPHVPTTVEPLPLSSPEPAGPPESRLTPRQWVRKNLFATPFGSVLTVAFGLVLAYAAYRLAWFAFVSSDWEVVRRNLRRFMIGGQYPDDQIWRVWVALYMVGGLVGLFSGARVANARRQAEAAGREVARPGRWDWIRRYWPALAAIALVLSQTRTWTPTLLTVLGGVVLALARVLGQRAPQLARFTWLAALVGVLAVVYLLTGPGGVSWTDWGGLHMTAFVTVVGIALSFPLGVLVALARRSSLPALRVVAVGYIELIRGVPLVTLLFLGQYVIPLFFPNTTEPPSSLTRALIAITLFEAAYVAEVVRGGLQAVPRGQREAAEAVGLSRWKVTRLIVLPQAMRAVIPAMVGQFISLFKDTSLLQIIAIVEFLDVAKSSVQQDEFLAQGLHTVTFAFAALSYWAVSYTMSRESRRLEHRLGVGERR
ncbi:MAG: amino acid ABC transporter permease [Acidimicrobiales bacterium]